VLYSLIKISDFDYGRIPRSPFIVAGPRDCLYSYLRLIIGDHSFACASSRTTMFNQSVGSGRDRHINEQKKEEKRNRLLQKNWPDYLRRT
jgi:hypothetical protein